ncbi:CBS domain-containing protein [Priestia megaterium]|nr:CBS domain-containing protein [Priestia megaterium]
MKRVRDVMTTDVESCTTLDNVYEVAVKMKELNVGAIPIVDKDQLIGMITDRDLVIRGIAEKKPNSSRVTDVMSDRLVTISGDASVEEAAKVMADHQIRRLPVVDGNKLAGILSLGDLSTYKFSNESAGEALSDISTQLH